MVDIVTGCAAPRPPSLPDTPAALRPPEDQTLYLEALARGVQIYECTAKADTGPRWIFKAPEAVLTMRSGAPLGKHYAGPTWELLDGSKVVGEVKAKDAGPTSSAIPWLLLAAKEHTGTTAFSSTRSVQRLATVGGIAPSSACTESNVGEVARVPYTATYYFYR